MRQFVAAKVEPQAMAHDRERHAQLGLLRELGAQPCPTPRSPEADGGAGLDATASAIIHDELAYAYLGFTFVPTLAHASCSSNNFYYAASPVLRAPFRGCSAASTSARWA